LLRQEQLMIEQYIKKVEGWDEVPIFPGTKNLIRPDGIQVQASVRESRTDGNRMVIHVSVCPLRACRPEFNNEEHAAFLLEETPKVLIALFGEEHTFRRMPADQRKPDVNHYFSEPIDA